MISIKTIFIFLVVSNLFALGVISYNYYTLRSNESSLVTRNTQAISDDVVIPERPKFTLGTKYTFDNPKLAAKALALLDLFTPVPNSYYAGETVKHDQPYFGISTTSDYCQQNRAAFTEKPDNVFEENHFMTETDGKSLIRRKVIKEIGFASMPGVQANMPEDQKKSKIFSLNSDLSNFFTTTDMYLYKKIGQEFSCLAQTSNHIPGHNILENKNLLASALVKYSKKYAGKSECFSFAQTFPNTFVLNDKAQCTDFFKFIDTPTYRSLKQERGTVFVRTTVSNDGSNDVNLIDADEEEKLRTLYKEGASCGTIKKDQIVQYHVYNPLIINGKPFDFRVYLLAASTNPLIVYYHDGFLRVAFDSTEGDSNTAELASSFLSNIAPGLDLQGKYQVMSFEELESYLLQKGLINESGWLDSYFRPELKKAMVHLMKMTASAFLKRSSIYELYAVDFKIDKDLKIWMIEVDANPEFVAVGDEHEKFLVKMLKDHFAVVNGLLKSRMKRVVNYINRQAKDGQIVEIKKDVTIKNLDQKIKEFTEITKNYWEPEYEPGKENGFSKIIDENYFGVQRNNWILTKECL